MGSFFARLFSMLSAILFVLGVVGKGNPWLMFSGSMALLAIGLVITKYKTKKKTE